MRALWKLTLIQVKLYLREPLAAFFTVFYAPMMLVLFGSIYGNAPNPMFGGLGTVDVSVPAFIPLIIVSVGLINVPGVVASNRAAGVLRRYRATPLHPTTYLMAYALADYSMIVLGAMLLILVGKIGYNMRFEGDVASVLAGFTLGAFCFFVLGFLIASLAPNPRTAQTLGMVLGFPMMFLSGATIPLEVLPTNVREIARFIPLTYVVTLMRGLWRGDSLNAHVTEVAVLVGLLALGATISAKTFRWE